jgi:hypothetical protein
MFQCVWPSSVDINEVSKQITLYQIIQLNFCFDDAKYAIYQINQLKKCVFYCMPDKRITEHVSNCISVQTWCISNMPFYFSGKQLKNQYAVVHSPSLCALDSCVLKYMLCGKQSIFLSWHHFNRPMSLMTSRPFSASANQWGRICDYRCMF